MRPDAAQIREWDAKLRRGGSIQSMPGTEESSYILAIVRRIHGLGIERGDYAAAYVDEVLSDAS